MGLSKAARNRLDEQLVFDEPEFEELLRAEGRPLLSDGRCLREAELVEKLTGNGIAMDRAWLWRVTREFPSSESVAEWLLARNGIRKDELRIHVDWVWVSVECLCDRWCSTRARFERLEQTIHEGYVAREFDIGQACRMWLQAWDQMQSLYARFRFDTIDDFDECLAGLVSVPAWAQDLIGLLQQGADLNPALIYERTRICEELAEFCYDCFGETPSAALLEPLQDEIEKARSHPAIPTRRAA